MEPSTRRDLPAARAFFARALATGAVPVEVTTDRAPSYPPILDELVPTALPDMKRYANRVEADHGRLNAKLRPMRGLKTFRSARILATGPGARRAAARAARARSTMHCPCSQCRWPRPFIFPTHPWPASAGWSITNTWRTDGSPSP